MSISFSPIRTYVSLNVNQKKNSNRDEESLQESHYNLSGNSISWGTTQDDQIKYEFDKIFSPNSSKKDIYHVVGCPIVPKLMDGINCTVVSFGNTHSGKRKTIHGDCTWKDEPFWSYDSEGNISLSPKLGLLARIAKDLWSQIQQSMARTEVLVSFCNIRSGFYDLLDNYEVKKVRNLKDQRVEVQDLTRTRVSSFEEMMDVVRRGDEVLKHSSIFRYNIGDLIYLTSNIIFTVYMKQTFYSNDGEIFVKDSRLELVSVQGNEQHPTRIVSQNEVKSLIKVIEALTEPTKFVPYRNSSLTRILSNSLNNNCSVYMLFHLSTHQNCIEQGKTILELANRAKAIEQYPHPNEVNFTVRIAQLHVQLAEIETALRQIKDEDESERELKLLEASRKEISDAIKCVRQEYADEMGTQHVRR